MKLNLMVDMTSNTYFLNNFIKNGVSVKSLVSDVYNYESIQHNPICHDFEVIK